MSDAQPSPTYNRLISNSLWKIISLGKSPASFRNSSSWLENFGLERFEIDRLDRLEVGSG